MPFIVGVTIVAGLYGYAYQASTVSFIAPSFRQPLRVAEYKYLRNKFSSYRKFDFQIRYRSKSTVFFEITFPHVL